MNGKTQKKMEQTPGTTPELGHLYLILIFFGIYPFLYSYV